MLTALALAVSMTGGVYGDERPAPPPLVQLAQVQARRFWADRGVTGCPAGITVFQSASVGEIGWGAGMDCRVWLSDDLVGVLDRDRFSEDDLLDACQAVTHEVGHALGLAHTATGVMAATGQPPVAHEWAPWFCHRWMTGMTTTLLRRYSES